MLAKQGKEGSASGLDASEAAAPKSPGDSIYMAKEVDKNNIPAGVTPLATTPVPAPVPSPVAVPAATPASAKSGRRVKPAPGWYHAAVPVMYTLSAVLIVIGLWAIGAVIYMYVTPAKGATAGYWFLYTDLDWSKTDADAYCYTPGTKMIAWTMLLSLPVSLALGIMSGMMQRHIRMTQEPK